MSRYSIPVWQMDLEAMKQLDGDNRWVKIQEVKRKVKELYPEENVNDGTINLQIVFHTINHGSRINSPSNQFINRPLFKYDKNKGFMILSEEEKNLFKKAYNLGKEIVNQKYYRVEDLADVISNNELSTEIIEKDESEMFEIAPNKEYVEFSLETELENYIVNNWNKVDFGDKLKLIGRQYSTPVGIIDLLCQEKDDGDYVIIELKKGKESDKVCGQIQRYMGWVKQNLAKEKNVRGIIITGDSDDRLSLAISVNPNISLKYYRVKFWLEDEPDENK
jgi:hypothetical protein